MGKIAFLYAGQGSQHPGMGREFYDAEPLFREVYDTAPVDFDLKETCLSDPRGVLNETEYTQPCMTAFAAGVTRLLKRAGVEPDYAAGLSLGEYSALSCAGALDESAAISLTAFRGRAMSEAARGLDCAMVAVLGLGREAVAGCAAGAASLGVAECANFNCPGQIVVGGERAAVERCAALAKERGARRCVPLKVSGPFHTSLMAPAGEALREKLRTVKFRPMRIPVLFNCLGDVRGEDDDISDLLVRQVQSSVYMEDTIRNLAAYGVDTAVEIGPGTALSGFVRKTAPEMSAYAVETPADLDALLAALKG